MIFSKGKAGGVYNIGGENEWANIDIVRHICGIVDKLFHTDPVLAARFPNAPGSRGLKAGSLIKFVADRSGHDRRY